MATLNELGKALGEAGLFSVESEVQPSVPTLVGSTPGASHGAQTISKPHGEGEARTKETVEPEEADGDDLEEHQEIEQEDEEESAGAKNGAGEEELVLPPLSGPHLKAAKKLARNFLQPVALVSTC